MRAVRRASRKMLGVVAKACTSVRMRYIKEIEEDGGGIGVIYERR